ncbi:MAG: hypothetical protein V5A55_09225 [Halovenus sp.]
MDIVDRLAGDHTVTCLDSALGEPLVDLLCEHYGTVSDPCAVEGDDSAYRTEKARRRLDWPAAHSWREAAGEHLDPPVV